MGILKRLKQAFDPINTMTPCQIVASVPSVWFRVPLAIFNGYFSDKATEEESVDYQAITNAMAATDVIIYGRDQNSVYKSAPFELALDLFSGTKEGSEKEKVEDATLSLLLGEMIYGGTNISQELAIESVDYGFLNISRPVIEKLFSAGFPPTEKLIADITKAAMEKAMAMLMSNSESVG